jgi:CRP-like cAMP-binding protein
VGLLDSVLWYKSFTIICADFEAGFMFTPEELRQAKIFACLDEGAPAWFYVLLEGRLRIVLDVHGKQTEFAEYEFKQGDFLGEVPLLMGTPTFGSLRAQTSCRIARLDKQQFHHLIRDSKEARTLILETLGETAFVDPATFSFFTNSAGAHLRPRQG